MASIGVLFLSTPFPHNHAKPKFSQKDKPSSQ